MNVYRTDKNNRWMQEPCSVIEIPLNTSTCLFVDESGKPNYKGMGNDVWFTLCGCLFETPNLKLAQTSLLSLKTKYWANGMFRYKKGVQRVVFHMKEIAYAQRGFYDQFNPFLFLGSQLPAFYNDYRAAIRGLPFTIVSVTVNKKELQNQYRFANDPYEYAMKLMLERVSKYMRDNHGAGGNLIMFVESCGQKESGIAHKNILKVMRNGTDYIDSSRFQWLKGVYFCEKRPDPGKSYYGLEVADFCAYPIKMKFKTGNPSPEYSDIKPKIFVGTKASSYGLKKVP